jgi:CCR4-NOT transcription complex subunit 3
VSTEDDFDIYESLDLGDEVAGAAGDSDGDSDSDAKATGGDEGSAKVAATPASAVAKPAVAAPMAAIASIGSGKAAPALPAAKPAALVVNSPAKAPAPGVKGPVAAPAAVAPAPVKTTTTTAPVPAVPAPVATPATAAAAAAKRTPVVGQSAASATPAIVPTAAPTATTWASAAQQKLPTSAATPAAVPTAAQTAGSVATTSPLVTAATPAVSSQPRVAPAAANVSAAPAKPAATVPVAAVPPTVVKAAPEMPPATPIQPQSQSQPPQQPVQQQSRAGTDVPSIPESAGTTGSDAAAIGRNNLAAQLLMHSMLNSPEAAEAGKPASYIPRNPYATHSAFPTQPLGNAELPALFDRLPADTLFFAFYYQQDTYAQYLAARQLKKQSWRFHKKYMTWFQRHEEPKVTTDDFEEGTYMYFDYDSGWASRFRTDFKFEFQYLEDELPAAS